MDLATPLEETYKLIQKFNEGENGCYWISSNQKEMELHLREESNLVDLFLRNMLIGLPGIKDTQCGCKGFKTDVAMKNYWKNDYLTKIVMLLEHLYLQSIRFGISLPLQNLAHTIVEVPVEWHHAETKRVSLWKDSLETISDLMPDEDYMNLKVITDDSKSCISDYNTGACWHGHIFNVMFCFMIGMKAFMLKSHQAWLTITVFRPDLTMIYGLINRPFHTILFLQRWE